MRQTNQGFTFLEILVALVLVAIMSAIGGPGMIAFLAGSKVSSAANEISGLLKASQKSAVRESTTCQVTIPTTGSSGSFNISSSCLPANSSISIESVEIRHNFADVAASYDGSAINLFDFKGSTDDLITGNLIFVLSNSDSPTYQKCIVVSDGLGLVRLGNYPGDDQTGTPTATSCNTAT